jgi:hypothetical protein
MTHTATKGAFKNSNPPGVSYSSDNSVLEGPTWSDALCDVKQANPSQLTLWLGAPVPPSHVGTHVSNPCVPVASSCLQGLISC